MKLSCLDFSVETNLASLWTESLGDLGLDSDAVYEYDWDDGDDGDDDDGGETEAGGGLDISSSSSDSLIEGLEVKVVCSGWKFWQLWTWMLFWTLKIFYNIDYGNLL